MLQLELACKRLGEAMGRIPRGGCGIDEPKCNKVKSEGVVQGDCGFSRRIDENHQKGGENHKSGVEILGRSIGDLFKHSWRPISLERWVWAAKPMVMEAREIPA
jgi:hypothetical protein